jgi:predicted nicotinamide N-methyase
METGTVVTDGGEYGTILDVDDECSFALVAWWLSETECDLAFTTVDALTAADRPADELEVLRGQAPQCFEIRSDLMMSIRELPLSLFADVGRCVWNASIVLSRYLASNADLCAGKDVLELGSGCGLAGLTCAHLGALSVCVSDHAPRLLENLRHNVALNQAGACAVSVAYLDLLHDRPPLSSRSGAGAGRAGLVLAADCIYSGNLVDPFVACVRRLLAPDGLFVGVFPQVRPSGLRTATRAAARTTRR